MKIEKTAQLHSPLRAVFDDTVWFSISNLHTEVVMYISQREGDPKEIWEITIND